MAKAKRRHQRNDEVSTTFRRKSTLVIGSRHIMIFLDGTWNDENGIDNNNMTTNVYRLFRALQGQHDNTAIPHKIEHRHQVALYFRGIGNDDDNDTLGTFYGGIFGAGEKRIRDNAYTQLARHYRSGDIISIFGFSRGAACARLLAAKIQKHGIPAKVTVIEKTVKNKSTGKLENYFLRYKNNAGETKANIKFMGLFDTVGSFGVPINLPFIKFQKLNLFRDLTVANNVQKVVHCVAIDENREPFIPTLCNKSSRVDEVWFTGVHSDVGGGYEMNELQKIPLNYVVTRLKALRAKTPIAFNDEELENVSNYNLENQVFIHHHGEGIKKALRSVHVAIDDEASNESPKIHHTVFKLMNASNVYIAKDQESFTVLNKVIYKPESIHALGKRHDIVEEG